MMMMMIIIIIIIIHDNGSQISYFSDLHFPECSVYSLFVKCCDFREQIQVAYEFTTLPNLIENCFFLVQGC